ncbi:sn-glycerol-3-phosphate ABC transporter ATP-binding protein UgpC [Rhizobium sp. CSW-27]|uniref:ABC transporter ATP-binding protein n=1 Tax=Rhizobium sp. CSW-27 TaxID=2839985 RepID=UPI001C0212AE|nr:sn-glycerol-3-phosphate ABC transporter ATP-binding protein UgpC [Rhizobium sp. CSW-27]MBT9371128.1 sn-glycerol-3-phosphate ABC transporter ATP-binding protein UgpC [Rhizobium sp. CSW-27]
MAKVSIEGLKKSYGAVDVIRGVDVEIEHGEFVILVGPSGCGKSTMLRMVAGLEDITSGTIAIGDRVVNDVAPKDRDIAMVFQNYALYPQMTVAQNMGFALEMAGWKKPAIEAKVQQAAAMLGLEPLLGRKPAHLSGGQRQRVAMGRAIVRDPAVFLFDEPLSNLDAKLRVQMRAEIKALHNRLGSTIIYVTHDQVEAMTMADRIVVLNGGHVEQIGSPLELYDHPANLFVASFLGSPGMNFFDVTAVPGGVRLADGTVLPVPARYGPVEEGCSLKLGLRPDSLVLDDQGPIAGRVKAVEPTGLDTYVALEVAGQEAMIVVKERVTAPPGSSLRLSADSQRAHLFNQDGVAL